MDDQMGQILKELADNRLMVGGMYNNLVAMSQKLGDLVVRLLPIIEKASMPITRTDRANIQVQKIDNVRNVIKKLIESRPDERGARGQSFPRRFSNRYVLWGYRDQYGQMTTNQLGSFLGRLRKEGELELVMRGVHDVTPLFVERYLTGD